MKVAVTWFVSHLAGLAVADPTTMHLMDVASGHCLQTGVTGATGGLTLQPQCNVPNDSKVYLLSHVLRPCTLQGFRTSVQWLHDSQKQGTG